jgi:hypothetical protein
MSNKSSLGKSDPLVATVKKSRIGREPLKGSVYGRESIEIGDHHLG